MAVVGEQFELIDKEGPAVLLFHAIDPWIYLLLADLPLSIAADTVTLPWTIHATLMRKQQENRAGEKGEVDRIGSAENQ